MTHVRNQKGSSLAELLAALPAGMLVTLIAMGFVVSVIGLGLRAKQNLDSGSELNRAQFYLRRLTQFAVNVRYSNVALDGRGSLAGEGYVRTWEYNSFADAAGSTPVAIGYFNFEGTLSNSTTIGLLQSRVRPVAIFFQPPTPTAPGALLITIGPSNGAIQTLLPGDAQLVFSKLVGIRLFDPIFSAGNVLERISVELTARTFVASDSEPPTWCPKADLESGTCSSSSSYRDTSRQITLSFGNNKRFSMSRAFEFASGVYLFRPAGRGLFGH